MRVKLFLFLVGVLVLTQMLLYTQILIKNDLQLKTALKEIEVAITLHQDDIIRVGQSVKIMERNKRNVPVAILEGVQDPEKKFLDFMDYLDNSELGTMQGSYNIVKKPTIESKPVPLQKTDFTIQFQFLNPSKLESVLGYLLSQQQDYPLRVNMLEIKRVPNNKPQVYLDVSLLLPAKLQGLQKNNSTGGKEIGS